MTNINKNNREEENTHKFTNKEVEVLINQVINKCNSKSSSAYEVINYKLDSIEAQTTRTNGRLTDVEKKVQNIEIDKASRLASCPQSEIIKQIHETTISTNEMRRIIIRGITLAGVFFAILFALLRIILEQ